MGSQSRQFAKRSREGQFVPLGTQSADHALGNVREIRVVAEGFARMHVRQMDFDERNGGGQQRVPERDTGMGEGGRIEDQEIDPFVPCLVNPFNQFVFRVALEAEQMMACLGCLFVQPLVDLGQARTAIGAGFTAAEPVQVGSV